MKRNLTLEEQVGRLVARAYNVIPLWSSAWPKGMNKDRALGQFVIAALAKKGITLNAGAAPSDGAAPATPYNNVIQAGPLYTRGTEEARDE